MCLHLVAACVATHLLSIIYLSFGPNTQSRAQEVHPHIQKLVFYGVGAFTDIRFHKLEISLGDIV